MYDIFISYKREDRQTAHLLAEALVAHGLRVWWDIELLPGDKFADEINTIIRKSAATIVLWSELSVKSNFVKAEASLALNNSNLIPLRLEQCELPLPFGEIHTLDISGWTGDTKSELLVKILQSIEKIVGTLRAEIHDENDVNTLLEKPNDEAVYWKEISENPHQHIEEYELYLKKFGEDALFNDLANLRVLAIKKSKRIGLTKTIAAVTGILTLVILASQVYKLVFPTEVKTVSQQPQVAIKNTSVQFVQKEHGTIILDNAYKPTKLIKASQIIVTQSAPTLKNGTVIISNELLFSNNAVLKGDTLTVVALKIKQGRISTSSQSPDGNASNLLVVSERISGTTIDANGANGNHGFNGADGRNGAKGTDGRNGSCKGFGNWKSAHAGGNGGNGSDGGNGGNGHNGGNGGNILLLLKQVPSIQPTVTGGIGGKGGSGGAAGQGGAGGRGGSGCTGLGGAQSTKPNGSSGVNGKPGKQGIDGLDGKSKKPVVKLIQMTSVLSILKNENTPEEIVKKLREI